MCESDKAIYHVDRTEEDGVEEYHVFRFAPWEKPARKVVLDSFPSREEADGEAAHMNRQWNAYFERALEGSAAFTRKSDSAERIAERAQSIATAAVEVFTR